MIYSIYAHCLKSKEGLLNLPSMDIQAKLIMLLPLQTGSSAKGEWKKQDAIFETAEQFPKKVCISFWGDKAEDIKNIKEGTSLKVHVNIESREYNGKWYTDLKAWKIESAESGSPSVGGHNTTIDKPHDEAPVDLSPSDDSVDELPF